MATKEWADLAKIARFRHTHSMTSLDRINHNRNRVAPPLSAQSQQRKTMDELNIDCHLKPAGSESRLSSANFYKKRLSHAVIDLPKNTIMNIKNSENIGSYGREWKHFSETTTMHGPKRVRYGKNYSLKFWLSMVTVSMSFLLFQIYSLYQLYDAQPILSQVSFQIKDEGVEFPMITLCNFNPVKYSALDQYNKTGDMSALLLDYLLDANAEAPALYSTSDKSMMEEGERLLQEYKQNHPNFTITEFFSTTGFHCHDVIKSCSFGGRVFDCCSLTKPVMTTMGKCHTIDIRSSNKKWMQKQTSAGVHAGLQLVMDCHLEEQFRGERDTGILTPSFENGFRYYIHDRNTIPYLVSEGISVSPGMRVYSALSKNVYNLLSVDQWGNCTSEWPAGLNSSLPYTAASCESRYRAQYYYDRCGCSPSNYDVEDRFPVCSPYQTIQCMRKHMATVEDDTEFEIPRNPQCKIECNSNVYQSFNSYGQEFSAGSLRWLHAKYPNFTMEHIQKNFLTINVFFRDLSHTEYTQVQATTLTELLSNIGGNMGMFLGMSVITLTEIALFLGKMLWILISRSRRRYMADKKKREEEKTKDVEETVQEFKRIKSNRDLQKIFPVIDGQPVFQISEHINFDSGSDSGSAKTFCN